MSPTIVKLVNLVCCCSELLSQHLDLRFKLGLLLLGPVREGASLRADVVKLVLRRLLFRLPGVTLLCQ